MIVFKVNSEVFVFIRIRSSGLNIRSINVNVKNFFNKRKASSASFNQLKDPVFLPLTISISKLVRGLIAREKRRITLR